MNPLRITSIFTFNSEILNPSTIHSKFPIELWDQFGVVPLRLLYEREHFCPIELFAYLGYAHSRVIHSCLYRAYAHSAKKVSPSAHSGRGLFLACRDKSGRIPTSRSSFMVSNPPVVHILALPGEMKCSIHMSRRIAITDSESPEMSDPMTMPWRWTSHSRTSDEPSNGT